MTRLHAYAGRCPSIRVRHRSDQCSSASKIYCASLSPRIRGGPSIAAERPASRSLTTQHRLSDGNLLSFSDEPDGDHRRAVQPLESFRAGQRGDIRSQERRCLQDRDRSTGWRPAHGHWLVARAAISQGELGCKPGWSASREQIERRITAVRRYHLKLVHPACAAAGEQVLMADVHQDFYDTRRCHGDYSKGTDVPRDEFIADLRKAGLVERVSLKEAYDPAARYPNGCGGVVQSDGRVAFVWLRAKAPGDTPH